jgi:hypothetical protein
MRRAVARSHDGGRSLAAVSSTCRPWYSTVASAVQRITSDRCRRLLVLVPGIGSSIGRFGE